MSDITVNNYAPEMPPTDSLSSLANFIYRENQRIAAVLSLGTVGYIDFHNKAPDKPKEGLIRAADGVNWEPVLGGGKGIYIYYGDAWHKLG